MVQAYAIGIGSEFWDMTLWEFSLACEGFSVRHDRDMSMLAWQTAHLLQPYVKKGDKLTANMLLGKEQPPATRTFASAEEMNKAARAHNAKVAGHGPR